MEYKVIAAFADGQDRCHVYQRGETYPRAGYNPSPERIKELSTSANLLNKVLITPMKHEGNRPVETEPEKEIHPLKHQTAKPPEKETPVEKPKTRTHRTAK